MAKSKTGMSQTQKENIEKLINDLETSIDNQPDREAVDKLITDTKNALADRYLEKSELQTLTQDLVTVIESTGVTASEARTLFYDLQNIAEASKIARTNDYIQSTESANSDVLLGGLGNDTLVGVTSGETGVGQVDILLGGGGQDKFVLGDSNNVFYNDGKAKSSGTLDYAWILDFNSTKDTISLHGSASNYTLGSVPDSLNSVGANGTAIYYTNGQTTPELIGIIQGVNISDFSAFTFI